MSPTLWGLLWCIMWVQVGAICGAAIDRRLQRAKDEKRHSLPKARVLPKPAISARPGHKPRS